MKSFGVSAGVTAMVGLMFAFAVPVAGEADVEVQLQVAQQTYRREGPKSALPLFEKLSADFRAKGDKKSAATAIGYVGEIHWRLGNYGQAGEYLDQALTLERETGDRLQEGKTLNVLGLLHWDLGEFKQAQGYFRQGSGIATELGDDRMAGAILNNLSLVHDELGEYYASLEQYQRVLELYRGVDFPRGEGDALGNIGGVYLLLGRYPEALDNYQRALVISEKLDSAISMSQDHGNLALSYLGLGKVDTALEHFDQAVELAVKAGMRQDEAYWRRGRGNALIRQGRYDLGLESHRAALAIYTQLDGKTELIEALHDMGQVHLLLGDPANAGNNFQRAMDLARQIGSSRGITINLIALGDLQQRQGAFEPAAALYAQALQRAKESGAMAHWSLALLRLAAVHRDQKKLEKARVEAARALDISGETGAVGLETQAVFFLAELDRLQGRLEEALAGFDRAIAKLAKAPDAELEWQTHYGKGLALADFGNKDAAISSLQFAVALIEGMRHRLQQERFRAGYLQDKYQVYVDLVRFQLETGQAQEAFSTAERLRSRSYRDLIEAGTQPDPTAEDEVAEFALKERIHDLRRALAVENSRSRPDQRQTAISVYSRELLVAEQEYQAFLDERRRSRPSAKDDYRSPTYADIKLRLLPGEALLEYVVGSEDLMAFLLTRDALIAETTPLRRENLQSKVELLRNLIRRQDTERWKKPAASLAKSLLEPFYRAGRLDGIKHLYLVPHGNLNYLPFALLPVGGMHDSPLVIEKYTLTYLPTAAALMRPNQPSLNDSSMLSIAPERSRLQHASAEARAVNALFGPDSKALLGRSATETAFKNEAANYRLLHLATHGYFNKFNPLLSGLELESDEENDGQLGLHEILGLHLDADLVTLSACQTGLGSGHFTAVPAGDDFVSLTRAFLYAGAGSVMATLWEIDDRSTVEFMEGFYRRLKLSENRQDKAVVLALAQRELRLSERYKHPYYWAPFILVGSSNQAIRKQS